MHIVAIFLGCAYLCSRGLFFTKRALRMMIALHRTFIPGMIGGETA
jgi:hypothetical protein